MAEQKSAHHSSALLLFVRSVHLDEAAPGGVAHRSSGQSVDAREALGGVWLARVSFGSDHVPESVYGHAEGR